MPDIERLMEQWPGGMEEILRGTAFSDDLAVDLNKLARICLAILDIPTYGSVVESLHVMFTVYLVRPEGRGGSALEGEARLSGVVRGQRGVSLPFCFSAPSPSPSPPLRRNTRTTPT